MLTRKGVVRMMEETYYFEGSETFFADVEFQNDAADDGIINAVWISQR